MHKLLALLANGSIEGVGASIGAIARVAVERGWVYFPFVSQVLSQVPFSFGWKLRRSVYAHVLSRIGRDAVLHYGVVFDDAHSVLGDDLWISCGCYIEYAEIGDHVLIGPHAVLLAGGRNHHFDRIDVPIKHQGNLPRIPLKIGDGVWIGANATVMADVGHDAIVGAGAVVTRPVPPYAIVTGNPARIMRMRDGSAVPDAHQGKTNADRGSAV